MAVAGFEELCAGYCELLDVSPPALNADSEGRIAFHVILRGVAVNLVHCADSSPDHFFALFSLGPPGPEGDKRHAELQALLDANFVLQVHPPTFSRNPATGDVVLQYVCPLFDTTPVDLHELVDQGVGWSLQWRENLLNARPGREIEGMRHASPTDMFNLA